MADLTDPDECRKLLESTINKFKKLNHFVNCANLWSNANITDENIVTKYHHIMDTNMRSVVLLTHLCAQHLDKTGGNIILLSGFASLRPVSIKCTLLALYE